MLTGAKNKVFMEYYNTMACIENDNYSEQASEILDDLDIVEIIMTFEQMFDVTLNDDLFDRYNSMTHMDVLKYFENNSEGKFQYNIEN